MNQGLAEWPFGPEHYLYNGFVFMGLVALAILVAALILKYLFRK